MSSYSDREVSHRSCRKLAAMAEYFIMGHVRGAQSANADYRLSICGLFSNATGSHCENSRAAVANLLMRWVSRNWPSNTRLCPRGSVEQGTRALITGGCWR